MSEFPLSALLRLLREGSNAKISRSAVIELGAVLEAYAATVARESIRLAKRRNCKTVKGSDVRAAASQLGW